jgi:hypothetical protein
MVFPKLPMNLELVVAADLSDMAAARAALYTPRLLSAGRIGSTQNCQHLQPSIDTALVRPVTTSDQWTRATCIADCPSTSDDTEVVRVGSKL